MVEESGDDKNKLKDNEYSILDSIDDYQRESGVHNTRGPISREWPSGKTSTLPDEDKSSPKK